MYLFKGNPNFFDDVKCLHSLSYWRYLLLLLTQLVK